MKELGLEGRVLLSGQLPWAARVMSAFDVFVFASREDSFGLVLIEAMAARLPIITSASGGVGEVVDESALLVHGADHREFAMRMREVYGMPVENRLALGAPGHERVRRYFSQSAIGTVLDRTEAARSAREPEGAA